MKSITWCGLVTPSGSSGGGTTTSIRVLFFSFSFCYLYFYFYIFSIRNICRIIIGAHVAL